MANFTLPKWMPKGVKGTSIVSLGWFGFFVSLHICAQNCAKDVKFNQDNTVWKGSKQRPSHALESEELRDALPTDKWVPHEQTA
jgi:hypothetical protein